MDQDPQGLGMGPEGPPDGVGGCSPPRELEKARQASYFSGQIIFLGGGQRK